tara:strand:+ start:37 stop:255 length:219 start_codon:yes stop_codon:yes gene_type:complete
MGIIYSFFFPSALTEPLLPFYNKDTSTGSRSQYSLISPTQSKEYTSMNNKTQDILSGRYDGEPILHIQNPYL